MLQMGFLFYPRKQFSYMLFSYFHLHKPKLLIILKYFLCFSLSSLKLFYFYSVIRSTEWCINWNCSWVFRTEPVYALSKAVYIYNLLLTWESLVLVHFWAENQLLISYMDHYKWVYICLFVDKTIGFVLFWEIFFNYYFRVM